jgi:TolA-binding protein
MAGESHLRTGRNTQEDGLDPFVQGVVELIDGQAGHAGQGAVAGPGSFATVATRLMRIRQRRGRERIAAACVGCAVVAGLVGFWIRPHWADRQPATLTYTVNGQLLSRGSDIAAGSVAEPVLSFSDGTRIQLGPRARGRVVEIGPHGARIALEEGKARVEVAHRAGAQWLFEAGPFLISVHGTAFSFGWSARDSRLDVKMDSGVVSVTGPLSGGEIFLRAGQTLSVILNDQGAPKTDDAPGPRSASISPALAPPAPTGEPSLAPRWAERAASTESWVAELADGKAAAVVADARRMGLAKVLDSSSSEDLAALADASRYERNDGLARSALLAQRRRFPRSVRASEASFLLGRLDDASDAGAERALRWYDGYLGEAPRGAYVSEALGRKMMVLERTNRHTEATAIAADYLRRFPGGTYAHAAQALTRTP